ncbi:hypothetical protein NPIL_516731 [Nephila pilipes]|uniref:Uncharacterized protein n=1 Tax=Nephila pilipes TaxID=299642 RepID=A0A8X6TU11_NEPPI|nr:hypothetical protein NPIL_516731 [Nephila pilipes]
MYERHSYQVNDTEGLAPSRFNQTRRSSLSPGVIQQRATGQTWSRDFRTRSYGWKDNEISSSLRPDMTRFIIRDHFKAPFSLLVPTIFLQDIVGNSTQINRSACSISQTRSGRSERETDVRFYLPHRKYLARSRSNIRLSTRRAWCCGSGWEGVVTTLVEATKLA